MSLGSNQRSATSSLVRLAEEVGIIGQDERLLDTVRRANRVAATGISVLILGARGTGKELFAKLIHKQSSRNNGPFETLNCAAIPETLFEAEMFGHEKGAFTGASESKPGRFELASEGTLFFDELGEMPMEQQARLLRVMQEGKIRRLGAKTDMEVNPRIIAATNVDIPRGIEENKLREDVLDRFAYKIRIPSLFERSGDIPILANKFLEEVKRNQKREGLCCADRLSAGALRSLKTYHWPGNVRELRSVIQSACIDVEDEEIQERDISPQLRQDHSPTKDVRPYPGFNLQKYLDNLRNQYMERALEIGNGNKSEAARLLGVTRQTVDQWKRNQTCIDDKYD